MEYISNQLRGMGGYPPVEMQGVNVHAVVFLELMRREVVWYLEDARERVRRIRTEVAWVEGEILSAKEVVGRDKVMELEKGVLDLGF